MLWARTGEGDPVDSAAQPMTTGRIPDLRDTPLNQLARQVADGDAVLGEVMRLITGDQEGPSRVAVMAFNSAI
jgi:FXSXX-COOH protein